MVLLLMIVLVFLELSGRMESPKMDDGHNHCRVKENYDNKKSKLRHIMRVTVVIVILMTAALVVLMKIICQCGYGAIGYDEN